MEPHHGRRVRFAGRLHFVRIPELRKCGQARLASTSGIDGDHEERLPELPPALSVLLGVSEVGVREQRTRSDRSKQRFRTAITVLNFLYVDFFSDCFCSTDSALTRIKS